jgi:putative flippase GtrA
MGRLLRFGLTGALTTGIAYVVFVGLIAAGVQYLLASAAAWAASLGVGFAINRRFTFGIVGPESRRKDFGLYVTGALLQLALGMAGYAILIGRIGLDPTPAFICNLVLTTTFSFLFLRFITFRRAAQT